MEIHGLFCWNWSAHDGSSISNSFPKSIIKPLTSLPSHQHASNDHHQGIAAGSTIAINIYNHPQRVFAWIYFFQVHSYLGWFAIPCFYHDHHWSLGCFFPMAHWRESMQRQGHSFGRIILWGGGRLWLEKVKPCHFRYTPFPIDCDILIIMIIRINSCIIVYQALTAIDWGTLSLWVRGELRTFNVNLPLMVDFEAAASQMTPTNSKEQIWKTVSVFVSSPMNSHGPYPFVGFSFLASFWHSKYQATSTNPLLNLQHTLKGDDSNPLTMDFMGPPLLWWRGWARLL